jgi:hypothetical protein
LSRTPSPDCPAPIDEIEVPEVAPGILSALSLPAGWSATELTAPIFGDPGLKDGGATAAWLYLSSPANADAIGYDGSTGYVDFNLVSNYGGTKQADISTAWSPYGKTIGPFDEVTTVDPLTPNVPEPGTWVLMGLGALGLVALRRRKSVVVPVRG